ncbi:hypothetical protein MMPV_007722 [Pyropia vietnamensis]
MVYLRITPAMAAALTAGLPAGTTVPTEWVAHTTLATAVAACREAGWEGNGGDGDNDGGGDAVAEAARDDAGAADAAAVDAAAAVRPLPVTADSHRGGGGDGDAAVGQDRPPLPLSGGPSPPDEAAYAELVRDVVPRSVRSRSSSAGGGGGEEGTAAAMRLGTGVGLNVVVSMATGATVGGWLGARVVEGAGGTAAERRVGTCVGALVGLIAAVFVEGTLVVVRLYAGDVVAHGQGRVKL